MRLITLIGCIGFAISAVASSNNLDAALRARVKESAKRFFEEEKVLALTVKTDFTALRHERDRVSNDYHPATVIVKEGNDSIVLPVKIKTRGNFRLKAEHCDFPPLRFNFKKRDVLNTVFEGQDKLKLVTHCRDTSAAMQQTMLREYLVYKLYNQISDYSLRVRLVKVRYVDINYGWELEKYAFFIESVDQMAQRMGVEEVEMANLTQQQLLQNNAVSLALFNYMIGNTDWSIPKLHNVKLFRSNRHNPPIAVPYDFDMSEFVGACYMQFYMGRELHECRYKGKRVTKDALEQAIAHYESVKKDLQNVILNFPYLDLQHKQECLTIIDTFYDVLANKQVWRRVFIAEALK
ncbi:MULTISPECIES: hypothetical protein [unclassified Carboxylicivirga]|uniref:hypothetical protein n=1 Tax=Carboxylicivirga TaxID=1628153 RepID=UPI003D341D98